MPDPLTRLLADRDWLLADGATATNLFNMGLDSRTAPDLWNVDAPDKVRQLYRDSITAGADLFLTNTFGANAARLRVHGAAARVAELNRSGAALARDEADRAGRPVVVGGSIGPTGQIMAPLGSLSLSDATAIFHEQASALKEAGVDLLWVETLSSLDELRAAARAAAMVGMPWCASMSFETAGRSMMGVSPAQMVALADRLPNPPLALGANCGTGAAELLRSINEFVATGTERPLIAKGNAGVPRFVHGHIHYDGTPDLMAEYAVLARDMGVRIIGGCCGTTADHLRAMHDALTHRPRGPRPSPEQVAARLAGFGHGDGVIVPSPVYSAPQGPLS
ncbi:betaine--homocysteine S-methyltransferase [Paracoccus jiaweipingae]|uniref:betaine--homocysteine S-methyltransferase n=1 Tax=unclassified Paracoccus (in: a-proteobacteria) TaxID=2688777 RepID=UPI00378D1164